MHLITVKILREIKNSKLLQKARVHIAKIKPGPDFDRKIKKANKSTKSKCYKALGEIHNYLSEIK